MKKYYKILGLDEGASKKDIQDYYDKLSIELDPKNNDDLDFFKEEFSLLQEAYEKLMGYHPDTKSNKNSKGDTGAVNKLNNTQLRNDNIITAK